VAHGNRTGLPLRQGGHGTEHSSQFNLALTQGSFRIVIGPLHAKFVNALTITGNEVDAKPGCQPFSGSALLAQSIFIAGSGTVSLP
jgi:hypothetical protein